MFGEKHNNTASAYHNLAITYRDLGDYAKAVKFYNKSLKIDEKVLLAAILAAYKKAVDIKENFDEWVG